jgi:hypothetical protein
VCRISALKVIDSINQVKETWAMKRLIAVLSAVVMSSSLLMHTATAELTGGTWTLTTESVSLNLRGVSPYVEKTAAGLDRIWFASPDALPNPVMVVDCNDSGECTRQTLASRFGSDATVVTLKDGTRKAFFVDMGPSGKKIRFATITGNTFAHGAVSDLNVAGSTVSQTEKSWGVPDSVVLPDGRVRVYWVLADQATGKPGLPESVVSATSTDATATTFVRDPGMRLTGGYVDTDILRAVDGDWVMIVSTGPGGGTQYLYMATSKDGLTWDVLPNSISTNTESALDPTGYEIGTNTWRIYYASAAPGRRTDENYILKRATLTWKETVVAPTPTPTPVATDTPTPTPSATATPTPSATVAVTVKPTVKKKTITCVKGKSLKKVTGVNPKCPTGYKKK